MHNNSKHIFSLTLLVMACLVLGLAFGSTQAFANSLKAEITFNQKLSLAGLKDPSDFTTQIYVLEPENQYCPLPDGAKDNAYQFSIAGSATKSISIAYPKTGIYKYKAYQVRPQQNVKGLAFDDKVYDIEVYVQGPDDVTVISKVDGVKTSGITWDVTYTPEVVAPTPIQKFLAKTGDILYSVVLVAVVTATIGSLFIVLGFKRKSDKKS